MSTTVAADNSFRCSRLFGFFRGVLWLVFMASGVAGCQSSLQKFEFIQPKMGTGFRIVIYAATEAQAKMASDAAYRRIDQLNAILSDYDPNSELSRLSQRTNSGPMADGMHVSDDLWRVLERSVEASKLSDGIFDITIGPCVRLWRRSRDMGELPTPERLAEARACVGYQYIRLNPADHSVQLLHEKMRLDVGGIAKGYTADQCLALLRQMGFPHAIVGAAGDVRVGDPPPGQKSWRIAIQSLRDPEHTSEYVNLANYAISTSGDTERYVIIDGKRYSHVLDPRTGLGLTRRIGVTVIAPEGINSDWMTKPLSILGPEALGLIESAAGVAARIVVLDENNRATVYESEKFKNFTEKETVKH